MKAIWNGTVLAERDETVVIEENHYFPADAINEEHLKPPLTHAVCPWKGETFYFSTEIEGRSNKDASWYYLPVSALAKHIK